MGLTILLHLGQVQEAQELDLESLLDTKLEQHKDLVQGQLENGLKYVILPNKVPPERFEAHLEICAGTDLRSANLRVQKLIDCHPLLTHMTA